MAVFIERINAVPFQGSEFTEEFRQWVTILADSLNNSFINLEKLLYSRATITGTSQQAKVNSAYIPLNVAATTITLPVTSEVGSILKIVGYGAGGWILATNLGQTIQVIGNTANTSITSSNRYDCIEIMCVVADTVWVTTSSETAGFVIV